MTTLIIIVSAIVGVGAGLRCWVFYYSYRRRSRLIVFDNAKKEEWQEEDEE